MRDDRLLLCRSIGSALYATAGGSPSGNVRDVIAAQTHRDAQERSKHSTYGRATGRLSPGGALIRQLLTLSDIVVVVAAADARIHQRAVLRCGAAT
jgi:hypothetical protein